MRVFSKIAFCLLTAVSIPLVGEELPVSKTKRAHDYYQEVITANQNKNWLKVIAESKKLISGFSDSPFVSEGYFYQGVAFFELGDYEFSNTSFTKYLRNESTPKYFEDAIDYKYKIAEKFYEGSKRHLLGVQKLPKILPAKDEALEIYEEIITTLPRHDLTAKALYKKGVILYEFSDYKLSVDSFQTLIRRFPKHHLTPDAFIGIQKVYLKQSKQEFPDPDILELSEINLERFKVHFPGEPRVEKVAGMLLEMKDYFAKDLFEVGDFYERTKKDDAACIYYSKVVSKYPESSYTQRAKKRLAKLESKIAKKQEKLKESQSAT